MDKSKIYTLGFWSVKVGKEAEFIAGWESFARWTMLNQSGTVGDAQLVQDINEPLHFVSFGAWEGMQHVQEWRNSLEFKTFFNQAREICTDIRPVTMKHVASSVR